jgi:hypothetical protein
MLYECLENESKVDKSKELAELVQVLNEHQKDPNLKEDYLELQCFIAEQEGWDYELIVMTKEKWKEFYNCTPNDLFTIDETIEVKTPTIVLYDNDTNYFEIINDGVKEVKRKINDPNYTIRKDGMILPESSLIQEIHEDKEPYIAIPSLEQQEYIKQRIDEQLKNKISEIKKELKEEYKNYIKALIDKSIDSHIESAKDDYKKAINLNAKKHLSNTETIQDFYKNHNISEKSNFESNKFAHEIKLTASNNFDKNDFINDESPKLELKVKNNNALLTVYSECGRI